MQKEDYKKKIISQKRKLLLNPKTTMIVDLVSYFEKEILLKYILVK